VKTQRLRIRYAVSEPAASVSHREFLDAWGVAARKAGLAVVYSAGKKPAPQISVAALLPQGVTGGCEMLDVYLEERVDPARVLEALRPHAPEGVTLINAEEVGLSTPSVQSQLRWAEYEVVLPPGSIPGDEARAAIERFLAAATWPAEYRREAKVREYDLRPLVLDIGVDGGDGDCLVLRMALKAEQDNTARADQVLIALGLPQASRIHRAALHLEQVPAVVLNARRDGADGYA
jgi:radical SAM-linked protein